MPVSLAMEGASSFTVHVPKEVEPDEDQRILVVFRPKKVGAVSEMLQLRVLDGMFVDVKFFGKGLLSADKPRRLSSMEASATASPQHRAKTPSCMSTDIVCRQRQARSAHKLSSLINRKLMKTCSTSELDCLRDKAFEAGVFVTPAEQRISLPHNRDSLHLDTAYCQKLEADLRGEKRVWGERPKNRRERLEIAEQLGDAELRSIVTSSNSVDFGTVFIESTATRCFRLKNNTGRFIQVELKNTVE